MLTAKGAVYRYINQYSNTYGIYHGFPEVHLIETLMMDFNYFLENTILDVSRSSNTMFLLPLLRASGNNYSQYDMLQKFVKVTEAIAQSCSMKEAI